MTLLIAGSVAADDVAVTVYNSNLGVVSESRALDFSQGVDRLAFTDVPARIDAASVRFELVNDNHNVAILEQNYAFDLVSPEQMYDKYIDRRIELLDKDGRLYSGDLLAFSSGAVTLMQPGGQVKIVRMDEIIETNFPVLPDGLITRPTLFWLYQSDYTGSLDCQVSYQTSGISWDAEYVGQLSSDESELDLSGWASINNTSGKTYADAKLKLIAGDINREQKINIRGGRGMEMDFAAAAAPGFEEKAFFEYHMYTLPRRATLADKEIKQISLFEPASTKVNKIYEYQPDLNAEDIQVKVEFKNSEASGLGMPLPAGRVRLFKADDDGSLILLGEDRIDHTPKGEKLSLTVGNAFDIKGEQKLLNRTQVSPKIEDRDFQIELRNHKKEDVIIAVKKQMYGFWEVLESDLPYDKEDASTLVFKVPVGADKTATLRFKVRFTSR
jgi:hypothetical protein